MKRSSSIGVVPLPIQVAWLIWSFDVTVWTAVPHNESVIIVRLYAWSYSHSRCRLLLRP
ncbi:hypothetical protein [Lelliottia aquatilis]|uniref:hypothetical protein n=1 Tax=Lelliottia aquatilis TaxID=2080838 RepID=UPI0013FE37E9|nr:hypothetical protein [Lelliottia aquatilis]